MNNIKITTGDKSKKYIDAINVSINKGLSAGFNALSVTALACDAMKNSKIEINKEQQCRNLYGEIDGKEYMYSVLDRKDGGKCIVIFKYTGHLHAINSDGVGFQNLKVVTAVLAK